MSERRTLQTRGEVIEEYSRDFPAEIVEIYSRPLPGAVEPVPTEPTPRPRRKKRRVWKGLLILLAVAAVIALLAAGVRWLIWELQMPDDWGEDDYYYYDQDQEDEDAPITIPTVEPDADARLELAKDRGRALSAQEVYRKVSGAVVTVAVDLDGGRMSVGTGVIFREDGYILTNYHVIDGANSIKVTFDNGKEYTATYVGGEEKNDIAVIKVDATGLTPVVIGKSSDMLVGEQVTTIGNPLGELTFSESTGIISALDRSITMSDGRQMNMIQTDCAINSGNSGGPLFNSHGEVIGIVSAKYSSGSNSSSASVEGLGFAIPMDDVASMVSDLVKNGYVTGKPIMGISVADVDESVTSYGVPQGAIIRVVTPDLCGAKAGLQAGDIVTKIDNTDVTSASDLTSAIGNYKPGDKVTLTIFRSGETKTVEVTLEESTPEKTEKQNQAQQEYQQEYQQSQQQQQQSQQQQQGSSGWPFGSFGY